MLKSQPIDNLQNVSISIQPVMKKTILLILIIVSPHIVSWGQDALYDQFELGEFQVGFTDTVIYDEKYTYEGFGYNGMKPYFLQIWFPLKQKPKNRSFLHFTDFFKRGKKDELKTIKEQLKINDKETFIREHISENLETGEPNIYGKYTHNDIFDMILAIETRSILQPFPDSLNFPVIIYHHGSQSNSYENFLMAEYFASRGFVFISANFHLPYPNTIYGLKPFDKIIKDEDEGSLSTILQFAQQLKGSTSTFFIGHSWGAQVGFRSFDEHTTLKGFVSLETTLEFKTDDQTIKEYWPEVYQKIMVNKTYYPFPILLCAATGKEEPFYFFNKLNAQQITFASTKEEFEHNAYTSLFYLRYFIDSKIPQTDKVILKDRFDLYIEHIKFITQYFNNILNHEKYDAKKTIFITHGNKK